MWVVDITGNKMDCRAYPDEKGIETGSNSMRG